MKTKLYIDANVFASYKLIKEWDHKAAENFIDYITKHKIPNVLCYTSEFALDEAISTINRKSKNEDKVNSLLYEVKTLWRGKIKVIQSKNVQSSTEFLKGLRQTPSSFKPNTGDAIHTQDIIRNRINLIVTGNVKDFKKLKIRIKKLRVFTPDEAFGVLSAMKQKRGILNKNLDKLIDISHSVLEKALSRYSLEPVDYSILKSDPDKLVYKIRVNRGSFILVYSEIPKDRNLTKYVLEDPIKVTLHPEYSGFKDKLTSASNSEHIERTKDWRRNLQFAIKKLKGNPTGLFPDDVLKLLKLKEDDYGNIKFVSYVGVGSYKYGNRPVITTEILVNEKNLSGNLILNKNLESQIIKKESIKKIKDLKAGEFTFDIPPRFRRKWGWHIRLLDKAN